jgi:hypothetical protein
VPKPIDDHFLLHDRQLLDAEDSAFDALEHAAEDGDREHFGIELTAWRKALRERASWLEGSDYDLDAVPGRHGDSG